MTNRLYYLDSYLSAFQAQLVSSDSSGLRIRLNQTAFYPTSGGQPHDLGVMNDVPVIDVTEESGDIEHVLERPLAAEPGAAVDCRIDTSRRLDHLQQHSGQHLLSAVLAELFGAQTVSVHMGTEVSTVELAVPSLEESALRAAEIRCNQVVAENRPVTVSFEEASASAGLRKPTERQGTIRIVTIDDLDRSACGGTHVRSTGEIGCILLRRTERIRGNLRLEFVCGLRAIRQARSDYNLLSAVARSFSSTFDEAPKLAAIQIERLGESEKARHKLAGELAAYRGRDLHSSTQPLASGLRIRTIHYSTLDDVARAEAHAFAASGKAALIAVCPDPPSLVLAISTGLGCHAGNLLKLALQEAGGRGGGSATLAQGSLPGAGALDTAIQVLEAEITRTAAQY